ncbi:MAG: GTP pyrophosphokinase family protein [Emergencia sp.]|nr:GTP pyrophosphokinase family protein [Emergencia sp.]
MMKEKKTRELLDELLPDDPEKAKKILHDYDVLMMRYDSAIREVKTKLQILNDELSLTQQSPISSISARRKKTYSILEKLERQGFPITLESIEKNLHDVAGIRVICSFVDDIYNVADMLKRQDDLTVIQIKDYIKNPKPNGYRSFHMIVEVPVFFSNEKHAMQVEVQIRTVAMDFWATLEHQIKYKQDIPNQEAIIEELRQCADTISETDERMLGIREKAKIKLKI